MRGRKGGREGRKERKTERKEENAVRIDRVGKKGERRRPWHVINAENYWVSGEGAGRRLGVRVNVREGYE